MSAVPDRLRSFARDDPGTWSLIAGGVAGLAALVPVAVGAIVGVAPGPPAPIGLLRLTLGTGVTAAGVGVAAWYLLVERVEDGSPRRAGAAGGLAGVVGAPGTASLSTAWTSANAVGGVTPSAVAAGLGVDPVPLAGGCLLAVPLAAFGMAALARARYGATPTGNRTGRRRVER